MLKTENVLGAQMKEPSISGLVAYPSDPEDIGQTISRALDRLHSEPRFAQLQSWEESDVPGKFISGEILAQIEKEQSLLRT